jgi:prepilin-type processing-associated H-X9-DG protein
MPCYFGVFPPTDGSQLPNWPPANSARPYGGWFVHLLPYIDQYPLYVRLLEDIQAAGSNQDYYDSCTGTYGAWVTTQYNGHTYTSQQWNGTCTGYHTGGIWIDGIHQATFPILQCPSDPTATGDGLVYGTWGSTNYLANYNAWGNGQSGLWTPPQPFAALKDGLSNIVLFGEGYATCDSVGRIALYSWYYHNFGLDWYEVPNTLMFQDQPLDKDCDNWRAQSGHVGGMNVALADGSVRLVHASISQQSWTAALLPRDGQQPGEDW